MVGIAGCSISTDGTFRDRDGNVVSASPSEISETQRTVLSAKIPADLPESAEGGVLFDGKVESVEVTASGLRKTLFAVDRVIYGDLEGRKQLMIYSPPPGKTGIDFKSGEVYRVFTVYLDGAYRTWDWLGTVRLNNRGLGDPRKIPK